MPGQAVPVDGYEIPHAVREAVLLRNPASAFPWSWCTDRRASPHGWVELVTNQGTFPFGHGTTAQRIWHASAPETVVDVQPAELVGDGSHAA